MAQTKNGTKKKMQSTIKVNIVTYQRLKTLSKMSGISISRILADFSQVVTHANLNASKWIWLCSMNEHGILKAYVSNLYTGKLTLSKESIDEICAEDTISKMVHKEIEERF